MLSAYCLNAMPLSYVAARIMENGCSGVGVAGIGIFKIITWGLVLHSLLYGVISVCGFTCGDLQSVCTNPVI